MLQDVKSWEQGVLFVQKEVEGQCYLSAKDWCEIQEIVDEMGYAGATDEQMGKAVALIGLLRSTKRAQVLMELL
jgi:hypothetical protein